MKIKLVINPGIKIIMRRLRCLISGGCVSDLIIFAVEDFLFRLRDWLDIVPSRFRKIGDVSWVN